MTLWVIRRAALMLAVVIAVACGSDGSGPVIDMVEPNAAARGAAVELTGDRFCGDEPDAADDQGACTTPPNGFVNFGADADVVRATVRAWSQTAITVEVPQNAEAGSTLIVVTVNGVSSNAVNFEVQ
jgi:uncharacterized protein (TIGR03437 family)